MQKSSKKSTRRHRVAPVSPSSNKCEDSLKNFCEPGFAFTEEIHVRTETITPLLKEILDFRPRPYWG